MKDYYVYESPDGGKTIYKRDFQSNERELVSKEIDNKRVDYRVWVNIIEAAKTNAALEKSLNNLLLLYYTIDDDKRK
jgi:hypothetical protein